METETKEEILERRKEIENEIRNDREWFQFVSKRTLLEQMTLEKTIRANAEYMFYTNYNDLPGKSYLDTIQYILQ